MPKIIVKLILLDIDCGIYYVGYLTYLWITNVQIITKIKFLYQNWKNKLYYKKTCDYFFAPLNSNIRSL